MLVLSRKIGEAVMIGDGIEVVVLDTMHGKVRLGFVAARDVPIFRKELHDAGAREAPPAKLTPKPVCLPIGVGKEVGNGQPSQGA